MNAPHPIQDLVAEIVHTYSFAQLELDPLPSGVCFLWVTLHERNFVLEYHPTQGTGVSENLSDTPPFTGHDKAFPVLADAVKAYKQLLAEAHSANATAPVVFAENYNSKF